MWSDCGHVESCYSRSRFGLFTLPINRFVAGLPAHGVQDFDEKRREWRKQKNSVINAIGGMTARALRFEDKERKTIALYALEYYKVRLIETHDTVELEPHFPPV